MKVALLGDIGLFGKYSLIENRDAVKHFAEISEYLSQFDLVIGNLEVPFVSRARPVGQKSAYLRSDPSNVAILTALGVHAVSLANNHTFDYGRPGLDETLGALKNAGIAHFGVDDQYLSFEKAGARLRLRGYCSYTSNPLGVQSKRGAPGINELSYPNVVSDLRADQRDGFLSVLSIHSGEEHVNYPNVMDIRFARQLAKEFNFVYYGHHPHVVQGVESADRSLLAYSLGNFCFDDVYTPRSSEPLVRQSDNNRLGMILELNVRDGWLEDYQVTPTFMGPDRIAICSEPSVWKEISARSAALAYPLEELAQARAVALSAHRDERRSTRDLNWYLRRLNVNSLGIILRGRANRRKHRELIARHLSV